jgi:hypothetical protein
MKHYKRGDKRRARRALWKEQVGYNADGKPNLTFQEFERRLLNS